MQRKIETVRMRERKRERGKKREKYGRQIERE